MLSEEELAAIEERMTHAGEYGQHQGAVMPSISTVRRLIANNLRMRDALEKLTKGMQSWAERARHTGNPVPTHIIEMWLKIARPEEAPDAE